MDEPIFDKDYCDTYNIQADWFKFDKTLAGLLCALVEEGTNEKGQWVIKDENYLSYTAYAVIQYFLYGCIPAELEQILNKPHMKLSKVAYLQAVREIEIARSRVAENRYNGGKGGRPPRNQSN